LINWLKSKLERIKIWYEGEFVPYDNDTSSGLVFLGGYQKLHWTARAAKKLASFWYNHWKWIITTTLAFAGLFIALMKFK
jgi:hypothetical protein